MAVVRPETFKEVAAIYSRCNVAVVTKMHSALFCLANNVPFSMITYDAKCDALLELLYDCIEPFSLNLFDSEFLAVEDKLSQMVDTLDKEAEMIKLSQILLKKELLKEYRKFQTAFGSMLRQ